MDTILNSGVVNALLKLAFSKSGVFIRWMVGYIIAAVATLDIIPDGNIKDIQLGLTQGLTAVVAILYALLQYWLNKRRALGVNVVKQMINESGGTGFIAGGPLKLDGVIGNNTIFKLQEQSGINASGIIREQRPRTLE